MFKFLGFTFFAKPPKVGSFWYLEIKTPFRYRRIDVQVTNVKDGWVEYKHSYTKEPFDCKITTFLDTYKPV